ncbi:MAG: Re/Si-specific NAD(P)(+) transhydrogenase subunit alpha [Fuerstiella sp.]|nr:Re/Si-specific NAD(P)(+) transhydrogenase subunit alpha [Fuerstiella sp.]
MSQETSGLTVGIPSEPDPDERRVAVVPATVSELNKLGLHVIVESGAGMESGFSDEAYRSRNAAVCETRDEVFQQADIVLQVQYLGAAGDAGVADIDLFRNGQIVIGSCDPLTFPEPVRGLADRGATGFSLELVPRITRAQSMDVLSSMATIAGYRAVLLAATAAPRMFPLLMTAAGTLKPARVLVIGAGVAGLQAIATAKRLGAVVSGYDIRPAVKEQVESLGGRFVELDVSTGDAETKGGYAREMDDDFYRRQQEAMKKIVADSDIVITTAAIPGRQAPVLVTEDMVVAMSPGSVIVDLAAERGGNCEVTVSGETIDHTGVKVLGPVNIPSDVPVHASEMLSRNILTFLQGLVSDGQVNIDLTDEILRDTLLTRNGQIENVRICEALNLPVPDTDGEENSSESSAAAAGDNSPD